MVYIDGPRVAGGTSFSTAPALFCGWGGWLEQTHDRPTADPRTFSTELDAYSHAQVQKSMPTAMHKYRNPCLYERVLHTFDATCLNLKKRGNNNGQA